MQIKPKNKNNKVFKNNRLTTDLAHSSSNNFSLLTSFIDNSNESELDFLLPTPSDGDNNSIRIKIFLFSTPKFLCIHINRGSKVGDVIRHIMTLYQKDKLLSDPQPILFPRNPEAYELRLIDDDEDYYKPFYEIGPLDRKDQIGEFESLAFVQSKNFKQANIGEEMAMLRE